jgi:hypothetical protein
MPRRPVSVIELPGYRRRADDLLSAHEQDAVVDLIAYEPTCGDLIPGTADFPALIMALYAKNEKADLSSREKKEFAAYAKEAVTQWRRR